MKLLSNLIIILFILNFTKLEKATCENGLDPFCSKCDHENSKCLICWHSFSDSKNCIEPTTKVEHCIQYSADGKCSKCKDFYFIFKEQCIEISISQCRQTDLEEDTSCILCEELVTSDGRCDPTQSCSNENCRSCLMTDAGESCLVCKEGFLKEVEDVNGCVKVSESSEGCFSVDKEGKCSDCNYGYYASNLKFEDLKCTKSEKYGFGMRFDVFLGVVLLSLFL